MIRRLVSVALVLGLSGVVLLAAAVEGREILVPATVPTIAEALQMTAPGDTIIIRSNYDSEKAGENFPIMLKSEITIICESGARIEPQGGREVFTFSPTGIHDLVIEGCSLPASPIVVETPHLEILDLFDLRVPSFILEDLSFWRLRVAIMISGVTISSLTER